jgi:hypothetical protein
MATRSSSALGCVGCPLCLDVATLLDRGFWVCFFSNHVLLRGLEAYLNANHSREKSIVFYALRASITLVFKVYGTEGHSKAFLGRSLEMGCLNDAFCESICGGQMPE